MAEARERRKALSVFESHKLLPSPSVAGGSAKLIERDIKSIFEVKNSAL